MPRILLCPDSFKGCLSAKAAAENLKRGIQDSLPAADVICLPLADGGEGTLDAFSCAGGQMHAVISVSDAYGKPKSAAYLYYAAEKTAVIESAQAIGIEGIPTSALHTADSGSQGVGELIADAVLQKGAKRILLTLGGSATTDGAMGALSALGIRFLDDENRPLPPLGKSMALVSRLEKTPEFSRFCAVEFLFLTDVTSPFCGKNGAAFVFAPQKGAAPREVARLDRGLENLQRLYADTFGRDLQNRSGMGAAGGLCGGLYAAFGGRVQDTFSVLADAVNLEEEIEKADLIFTGEGKTDHQTVLGKLPFRLAGLAAEKHKPCILISGSISPPFSCRDFGCTAAYALKTPTVSEQYAIAHAPRLLRETAGLAAERYFHKER